MLQRCCATARRCLGRDRCFERCEPAGVRTRLSRERDRLLGPPWIPFAFALNTSACRLGLFQPVQARPRLRLRERRYGGCAATVSTVISDRGKRLVGEPIGGGGPARHRLDCLQACRSPEPPPSSARRREAVFPRCEPERSACPSVVVASKERCSPPFR